MQRRRSCCAPPRACPTWRSPAGWRCARRSSGSGGDDLANSAWKACTINRGRVARGAFPPEEVAQVKAIACELPKTHGVPLSRFSRSELHRFVVEQAISCASASTIGRWLAEDAIKPWQQRSWIFPRDPNFLEKAGPILDLYEGRWEGKLLEPGDCVISADAKPSIQARARIHPGAPPARGRGQRVEHEYERRGAVCYLDAWDVRRGRIMGRTEPMDGIASFDRLVWQVMTKEPYRSAPRVFWIVDNGSDHRGQKSINPPPGPLAEPDPRAHPRPRQLAQPGRDLPLDHPAQGPRPQRLPRHCRRRPRTQRLRAPLQPDRRAVHVELHTRRPRRPPRPPRSARRNAADPTRRLIATVLPADSTKGGLRKGPSPPPHAEGRSPRRPARQVWGVLPRAWSVLSE